MKNCLLCAWFIFIFNLCWFLLILAENEATISTVSASVSVSENVSSDNIDSDEKSIKSDGSDDLIRDLEPSVDVVSSFNEKIQEDEDTFQKQVFAEATSQNSGVANEITNSGQPVLVTLADVATAELQQRAIIPSQQNEKSHPINESETPKSIDFKPEINQSRSEPNNSQQTEKIDILNVKDNLTEEIPSFSEWAQKQLEEAEKKKEPSNTSSQHQNVNGKQKLRWKNYASLDCGAKVVASNPEAVSPSAILSPSRDEYKLNTCTSRIWFVVELCEAIQAKKIDFANFELFSSSPKDFVVSVSDRFPTREWSNVGQFTAKDERDIQSFDLDPHLFGKYIKVEVKSHYGSEHYCPISLFRVYGTSEFEVLQKEDPVHADRLEEDDDDDDDESLDVENGDASKNLFSSATDAVISMVKKAAEVLGNKGNHSNQTELSNNTNTKFAPLIKICTSPSHLIVCDNCSDVLFGQVYELLSCSHRQIGNLVQIPFIEKSLTHSNICEKFGFDFLKLNSNVVNSQSNCVKSFFPERYLGAMCNSVAVAQNKVVLNISNHYLNDTKTVTDDDKLVNIETSEPHVIPAEARKEPEITDALPLETTETLTKSTCSTDTSYTSQIKPTKTITSELDLNEINTESSSPSDDSKVIVTTTETIQSNLSETVPQSTETQEHQDTIPDVENVTESVENLEEHLAHFINEFNNGDGQHLPIVQATTSTPQAQKESVFLRLSNRIKALERNMSLSGQYLEELSKRYKKQVEEIQKLLDKTIININEESKKKDERNKELEERLSALTSAVEALIAEKNSWSSTISCMIVSSLVTLFIISFCYKTPETKAIIPKRIEMQRRKSIDVVTHNIPQKKRRRPSDQALKIVRSSMENNDNQTKKKKKKKQLIKRSNSINTLIEESNNYQFKPLASSSQIWNRQESAPPTVAVDWVEGKHIEEIPFVLEESEHSSLEPLTLPPGDNKITAPSFLKTALTSRSFRVNGDALKDVAARKSASTAETNRKSSPTSSINGNLDMGEESVTPKKEKKGLKKIFKKVF